MPSIFTVAESVAPEDLVQVLPRDARPQMEGLIMAVAVRPRGEGRMESRTEGPAEGKLEMLRTAVAKVVALGFGLVPAEGSHRIGASGRQELEVLLEEAVAATRFLAGGKWKAKAPGVVFPGRT